MIPALDIDPFCQAFFDDPYPVHAALRSAGPVVYLPPYDIHAVARYDVVQAMLLDWRATPVASGVGLSDFAKEKPWRLPSLLLETDRHCTTGHGRSWTRCCRRRRCAVAAEFARAADALIDALLNRGTFDAVRDLAEAYPLTVFPDAVGCRPEPAFSAAVQKHGVQLRPTQRILEAAGVDAEPVLSWVQAQSCREALGPIGLGATIHAAVETGEFTAAEADPCPVRSPTAGVDTTVNGMGAAVYCLARFPAEFEQLRAAPSLARAAFEEAVRLESPVQTFFRTTTREVAIGDETIPRAARC